MKPDIHQHARELIACTGAEELSGERSNWLRSHLEECDSCREYAELTAQMASALRSIPFAAELSLVRTTQERVRLRARQLQQERARMHFVWMACALVALAATLTTPFLWQGFRWLGEIVNVSSPVGRSASPFSGLHRRCP